MKGKYLVTKGLMDPVMRGLMRNDCLLHIYQEDDMKIEY